jgi:type I restriction-modification system DNA methylase subunit
MESSRRDGYDGYCTWGGALLQPELVGLKAKIGLGGHKATIFIYTIDIYTEILATCFFTMLHHQQAEVGMDRPTRNV